MCWGFRRTLTWLVLVCLSIGEEMCVLVVSPKSCCGDGREWRCAGTIRVEVVGALSKAFVFSE